MSTNNKYFWAAIMMLFVFLSSCSKDTEPQDLALDQELEQLLVEVSNGAGKSFFTQPEADDYAAIPADPKNPLSKEKVELGKFLFHETALAIKPVNGISEHTYSCASCHFASAGFQAGRFQGIGEGGIGFGFNGEGRIKGGLYTEDMLDVQPIRTPAALLVAYQEAMLWNGQFGATGINAGTESQWTSGTPKEKNHLGFEGVETQAIAGLEVHRLNMEEKLLNDYGYKEMFDKAFPEIPAPERYSLQQVGLAIAAYERTLMPNQAPFQKWLKGDAGAMSDAQKQGAILFFGKGECANCHTGPALNKMDFSAIGMMDLSQVSHRAFKVTASDVERLGRGGFTQKPEDMYKFKIPQLYNLLSSPFYGHGSSLMSIRDVIAYKNEAVKENINVPDNQLSEHFHPLGLTEEEIDLITEFIEHGLYDDNLKRYEPAALPSGYCFPLNDPLAKDQMGCK